MRLIIGLGNPGTRYRNTRHNIGFMTLDGLAKMLKARFYKNIYLKADIAKKEDLILVKPHTFMNLSGFTVRKTIDKFRLELSDFLVICDDLNLPLGKLRLRKSGSSGGHKGLSSIIESLQAEHFARLRIGIDRPPSEIDSSSFVLSKFLKEEQPCIKQSIENACQCALDWATRDIEKVMAEFN
ncbi:MAG: aminoacyl-tRNA hydrolase [Candidatus Omnitrophica bacterium]|nr:aminoacyl-tRNA hydrolase [Candidatus Omnitrophota bacterium]